MNAKIDIAGGGKLSVPETLPSPDLQEVSAATILWNDARITVEACLANGTCRAWLMREAAKIILESTYHLPPPNLPAFPDAKPSRRKEGRKRWVGPDGKIYEWYYKKGEVEIYYKKGKKHLGGYDPNTGKQRSKPVPGRRIKK